MLVDSYGLRFTRLRGVGLVSWGTVWHGMCGLSKLVAGLSMSGVEVIVVQLAKGGNQVLA